MAQGPKTELRVGIFVFFALLIGGSLVFVIGDRRNMFTSKTTYSAVFDNIGGLKPGSPVRIAGVDVGTVGEAVFSPSGKIRVQLHINDDAKHLVRVGSKASVGNKGLLGDRLVDVSVGTGAFIPAGGELPTEEPVDLGVLMQKVGPAVEAAEQTAQNLRAATQPFADPAFGKDVQSATHHLATVLQMFAEGQGPMRRFFMDRELANRLTSVVENVDRATNEIAQASRSVQAITREVEQGSGSIHQLIYTRSGDEAIREVTRLASELATLLRDVRTQPSTVHSLFYSNEGHDLIENLTATTADLRAVMADVRAGRGTIGGFIVDPSIYEDVKRLVGNLERNEILRALVRYSIRHDEERSTPRVTPR